MLEMTFTGKWLRTAERVRMQFDSGKQSGIYMKGEPRGIQVRYSGRAQARTWGEGRDGHTAERAGGGDGGSVGRICGPYTL
jgi:hypothetical protein